METLAQDSSNVNPLALLFLLAMSIVMLRGPGRAAVNAILAIAAFLPLGQQVVLGGLHFTFFRILMLIGWARLLIKGETRGAKLNRFDKLFMWWALIGFGCSLLRRPDAWAGAECLGALYNDLGVYFLFRFLIKEPGDLIAQLRFLALVAVIVGLAMAWERITHKNPFYVFGGVPEFVGEREGRFRCQGPFRHPILAGTFAATLFPLMVGLSLQAGQKRWLAFAGIIGTAFGTLVAASSGALLTFVTAAIGFALWPMRYRMHLIRRGIVVLILGLALMMKAPVWYLIARVSELLGGTGWHRSYLIDQALNHFGEWWLIGSSYTAHWGPSGQVLAVDLNNMDITNHYVAQGLHGGALELGLFIAMIVTGFKAIGRALRPGDDVLMDQKLMWAFGVCLTCNCTALISICYFDQSEVFWLWLLAVLATLSTGDKHVRVLDRIAQPVEKLNEEKGPLDTASQEVVFESWESWTTTERQTSFNQRFWPRLAGPRGARLVARFLCIGEGVLPVLDHSLNRQ
jgi:hypothetical protein